MVNKMCGLSNHVEKLNHLFISTHAVSSLIRQIIHYNCLSYTYGEIKCCSHHENQTLTAEVMNDSAMVLDCN